jgi:hypothetical protein
MRILLFSARRAEKNLREGEGRMLEDKRSRKLLAAARCVYTLLCEKKIAALIIPHLTLRLKKSLPSTLS